MRSSYVTAMSAVLNDILHTLIESGPYLMLGFAVAGLLHVLMGRFKQIGSWLSGRGPGPVGLAALIGLPMPLCSCSVLPAAVSLRRQGASRGAMTSFLVSVPETDVVSIMMTYALLGTTLAVYRPVAALATAVVAGLLVNLLVSREGSPAATTEHAPGCCHAPSKNDGNEEHCHSEPAAESPRPWWWRATHYGFVEIFDDIIWQLLLGIVVAGSLVTILPKMGFVADYGAGPWAYLVMLALGIPVYVCATASTPVAASLIAGGVSPGAGMVFLLAGPATNIASVFVLKNELGGRGLFGYIAAIAACSVGFGWALDLFIPQGAITTPLLDHDHGGAWWEIGLTLVFAALVVASLVRTIRGRIGGGGGASRVAEPRST